jgi:hypothetical protein
MPIYSVNGQVSAGSDLPLINVTGDGTTPAKINDIIVGCGATPADVGCVMMLERTTDAGTGGTSLTVNKNNPTSPNASATAKKGTFSTPPADSSELFRLEMNQRATYRHVLHQGREFFSVIAASNGLMLNSESSTGTPVIGAQIYWEE